MEGEYKKNQLTFSYTLYVCIYFIYLFCMLVLDAIYNFYLLGVLILFVPALLLALFLLASIIRNIWQQRWLRVISILASPFIGAGIFWSFISHGITPDWVRFQYTKSYYLREVAQIKTESGKTKYKEFDWGATGGVGGSDYLTLIYDESDTLKSSSSIKDNIITDVLKLDNHFYLRDIHYP